MTVVEADEDVVDAEIVEDVLELGPGLHRGIPAEAYHRDPVPGGSLSSSVARKMLPPSCPALARHKQLNPEVKPYFDEGVVAHRLILGEGPEVVEVRYDSRRTNAAKAEIAKARAAGKVPMLTKDLTRVRVMVDAVRAHPTARRLFDPDNGGAPEQVIVWRDPDLGIGRRAMLDWLRIDGPRRPLVVDLKTTTSVAPQAIAKTIADHRYFQQDPWYRDGVRSLGVEDPGFLFCFVEKTPPHLVAVIQLDPDDVDQGARDNRTAMQMWADCVESGHWPTYYPEPTDIPTISLPRWAARRFEETW